MSQKRLQDDFYDFVNAEWLATAQIPGDKSLTGAFEEMDRDLEKLLKELISDWASGKKEVPADANLHKLVTMYKMIVDTKTRDQLGWKPAQEWLNKILDLQSFSEINDRFVEFEYKYNFLPLGYGVSQDFVNNRIKVLWLGEIGTILPSRENYDKLEKEKFLSVWRNMNFKLATSFGLEADLVNKMLDQALEFDNLLKDYVLTSLQKADYVSLYHPKKLEWFENKSKVFDLIKIAKQLVSNQEIDFIAVDNPSFIENLDVIFNENTFEGYRALMFFNNLSFIAPYITEQTRAIASEYKNTLYSIEKNRDLQDFAYDVVQRYFSMPLGIYYAKTYFGEQAKKDVEKMVNNMIKIYDRRLAENDWLSPATIEKARLKLSKLGVMVGYPEEIQGYYDQYQIKSYEQGGTIPSNIFSILDALTAYNYQEYLQKTNEKLWSMSPARINAYFQPFFNHIVFPAAILSAPFYDINQGSSANYGGIGAVIAHEISHAFDNNGAQFDENGSLNSWWTPEDYQVFKEKTQKAIELFDGIETEVGKVNGQLTVSENIADIGGFSCALEAAKLEPDFDVKKFFENWARIWKILIKPEAAKRRLESDVHAPGKQRANVQLSNCDLFYETYNIQPQDKMYVAPEKRVKIW
ncbi:M13 family metallopeptidase [Mycoplasmopsis gallopavonis]|uniref:Neutral endopeptidase n=1 Tax=Mycoplasmopsis gallopavonis TaxID=76629 RepID=A0A449AZ53_9BACT|nr:M13 family metallopeptidase [Mycoplasmopsis gallopavonis]RIV16929.1 M13 family peptidase [Mycoplasmopsis gallopavonis]VEU72736.1 Neutral endopeptidase [Mycoplasmopsis gallopavonis]